MNKKIFRLSLIMALIAPLGWVTLFPAATPAAAGAARYPFTAYNIACSLQEGKTWMSDDGIFHIRGRILQSVVASESAYHAGTGEIIGNANIDLATMLGEYHGTLKIFPTAVNGYWAGSWVVQMTPAGQNGHARLQGYGDLEGWSIKAELTYLPPFILANFKHLCGGSQPVAGTLSNGYILMPGGE